MMIYIPLIFIFFIQTLYGKTIFSPKKIFPSELKIILTSIQNSNLTQNNEKDLHQHLLALDKIPSFLNKKEIFFFVKTEVYKSILEEGMTEQFKIKNPNENLLKEFKEFTALKKNYSLFSQYIIESIGKDLEIILDSPFYKSFLFKKVNTREIPEAEIKKVTRNFTILYHWYELIRDYDVREFNQLTNTVAFKALRRMSDNSKLVPLLFTLNIKNNLDLNKMKYFTKNIAITRTEPKSPMQKFLSPSSLETIIDENIVPLNSVENSIAAPSLESFINDNIVPESSSNISKPWKPK